MTKDTKATLKLVLGGVGMFYMICQAITLMMWLHHETELNIFVLNTADSAILVVLLLILVWLRDWSGYAEKKTQES